MTNSSFDPSRREFLGASAIVPLYMTEVAIPKATGTSDKEFFEIDGARHIETYWVPEYVEIALGKLAPFFSRTLG